jgi:nucleoside-diphosphate-sugar epimerase
MTTQTAFVTGSTGFVALNLVDRLLADGWTVYALHRPGSSRAAFLTGLPNAGERLIAVQGDLCDSDFAALVPADVAVIFHVAHLPEDARKLHPGRAGITAPGFTPEGAAEHRRVNQTAMRNVLAAAARVRRLVYCSSWSAYGVLPPGTAVDESTPSTALEPTVPTGLCGSGRLV